MSQPAAAPADAPVSVEVRTQAVERHRTKAGVAAVIQVGCGLDRFVGVCLSAVAYDDFLEDLHLIMCDVCKQIEVVLTIPMDARRNTLLLHALAGGGLFVASRRDPEHVMRIGTGLGCFDLRNRLYEILFTSRSALVSRCR